MYCKIRKINHIIYWTCPGVAKLDLSSLLLVFHSSEPGSPGGDLHQVHQVLHQVCITELSLVELTASFDTLSPLNLLQKDNQLHNVVEMWKIYLPALPLHKVHLVLLNKPNVLLNTLDVLCQTSTKILKT